MNKFSIFIEKKGIVGEKKNILYNGLITNPRVKISEQRNVCDYIFIDFRDFDALGKYTMEHFKKMIIIDFRDQANIINIPCFKYFKRSVVNKNLMKFREYNREIIPISYCIRNESLNLDPFKHIRESERDTDIGIFFPCNDKINQNRLISKEIARYIFDNFKNYKTHVGLCGKKGPKGRNSIQSEYFEKMFHSKIVVNCNPDDWEGDYRTWEALSSGALVFVDNMITPVIHPLVHGKHVIFYDRNNRSDLKTKLLYYLNHPDLARKIAIQGNKFAIDHHKPSDRIDEILNHLPKK